MNTCRICKKQESAGSPTRLFKYSARHYAHAHCGIVKWGEKFLDMIPAHMVGQLPARLLSEHGLYEQAVQRIETARNLKGAH